MLPKQSRKFVPALRVVRTCDVSDLDRVIDLNAHPAFKAARVVAGRNGDLWRTGLLTALNFTQARLDFGECALDVYGTGVLFF